jgi:hypothetical protein
VLPLGSAVPSLSRSGRRYSPAAPALPTRPRSLAVPLRQCTPLACSDYCGHSATTRHQQRTARLPAAPRRGGQRRVASHVHHHLVDEVGAQLYPGSLATGTPQPFPWPPHRPLQTGCGVARRHRDGRALLTGPHPPGSGPARRLRSLTRWFLAYPFSSCLPDPDRLAVPARPGVVRAAPTLACVSTVRLAPPGRG